MLTRGPARRRQRSWRGRVLHDRDRGARVLAALDKKLLELNLYGCSGLGKEKRWPDSAGDVGPHLILLLVGVDGPHHSIRGVVLKDGHGLGVVLRQTVRESFLGVVLALDKPVVNETSVDLNERNQKSRAQIQVADAMPSTLPEQ